MVTSANEDLLSALTEATADLLFPSETDSPVVPYTYAPDGQRLPTVAALRRRLGQPPPTLVEKTSLDDFFAAVTAPPPELAGDEESTRTAARFQELVTLLKTRLRRPRVYRVGTIRIDVYVLGISPAGGIFGVQTTVVET